MLAEMKDQTLSDKGEEQQDRKRRRKQRTSIERQETRRVQRINNNIRATVKVFQEDFYPGISWILQETRTRRIRSMENKDASFCLSSKREKEREREKNRTRRRIGKSYIKRKIPEEKRDEKRSKREDECQFVSTFSSLLLLLFFRHMSFYIWKE